MEHSRDIKLGLGKAAVAQQSGICEQLARVTMLDLDIKKYQRQVDEMYDSLKAARNEISALVIATVELMYLSGDVPNKNQSAVLDYFGIPIVSTQAIPTPH